MRDKGGTNSKYEVKVTIGHDAFGKPIRKSFYGRSKRDARAKAEQYKIDSAMKEALSGDMTFGELAEECIKSKSVVNRSITMATYDAACNKFSEFVKDMKIRNISRKLVQMWADSLIDEYTQGSITTYLAKINTIFKYAVEYKYISENPCTGVRTKSKKEKTKKSVYSEEETDLVIKYADDKDKIGIAVDIMLSYGTTISETLGIMYKDIDFENSTISICRGVTYSKGGLKVDAPKNSHRIRTIAVSKRTLSHIKKFMDKNSTGYIINFNGDDKPSTPKAFRTRYQDFMKEMHEYYAAQNIDIKVLNPHELRHTRASIWVNQDVNLFAIAEEMGWSDLGMLRKVYGHPDINRIRGMLRIDE